MDLLAALAADPTLLPLWAVMIFAAGMYPIGMMFGCSPCCDPCVCASGATLPETITVTLDGFTDYSKKQLCTLSFSACYGSGGSGTVDAPGHSSPESDPVDDRGPITAVSLTDGGSGYAKLGRTAPTLSASVYTDTGSGASLDVTVTKASEPDECGLHYWEVSKITLLDGGTGYEPWDGVEISLAEGDSVETQAAFSITLAQLPPDLTLSVTSQAGSGAELAPQTTEAGWSTPQWRAWEISSVTVDDGGDGYTHLDAVSVILGPGTVDVTGFQVDDAPLSLVTANTEPTVSASVQSAGGTGAALTAALAETTIYPASSAVTVWAVESIAVDSAGEGYAESDQVSVSVVDGDTRSTAALAFVTAVDENGGIVAVTVYYGGEYFKGGPITGVDVVSGGGYVKRNGQIESVAVTNGGKYYREDASLPPYVASVTVDINQANNTPTAGTGAVITATVEDDPQSPDFGKITGLTVANGGNGYLAYVWETNECCGHYLNGQSIVLERWKDQSSIQAGAYVPFSVGGQYFQVPVACVYTHRFCGGWASPFTSVTPKELVVYVGFTGEENRAVAKIEGPLAEGYACERAWISSDIIESCSQFAWSATSPDGPSISVSQGGTYDPEWRYVGCGPDTPRPAGACPSCNVCCQGDSEVPEEVEMTIEWHPDWEPYPDNSPEYDPYDPLPFLNNVSPCAWLYGTASMPTSGTYVLQKTGNASWSVAITRHPPGGFLRTTDLYASIQPCDVDCGHCIKKCTVTAWSPFGLDPLCELGCDNGQASMKSCNITTPACSPSVELSYSRASVRQGTQDWVRETYSIPLYASLGFSTVVLPFFRLWQQNQLENPCQMTNGFWAWLRDQIPYSGGDSWLAMANGDYGKLHWPPGYDQDKFTVNWLKFYEEHPNPPDDFIDFFSEAETQEMWEFERWRLLISDGDYQWKDIVTITIQ